MQGAIISMSLNGWNNVYNEPILRVTMDLYLIDLMDIGHWTPDGHLYLIGSIDTSGHSDNAEYLLEVVEHAIPKCEEQFCCHIPSFVTNSEANKAKIQRVLKQNGLNVISYGCSAVS